MNMVNTNYNSTEDMIDKLQSLKGKTKFKFYKNISNFYNEMKNKNIQTQQDPFSKNVQGISKIFHEVILLMKFLHTKPQVKYMNIKYYDLYYTVTRIRDENKDIDNNDYINFNDITTPNHYIRIKPRETILR